MAIYKHVSTYLKHDGEFEPRIPSCRHKQQEDSKTPRVSVASTLEDCLTAIPNGGSRLDELNIEQRGYYLLFTIDTEKLGIAEEHIILTEVLYENDFVRDADVTNEVWITTGFTVPPEDIQLIRVMDWSEEAHDIIPHSIYQIADNEFDGDYLEAYQEVYQEMVPCSVGIKNVHYQKEILKEGQEVSLYLNDEIEEESILSYVDEMKAIEITEQYTDEITIKAKEDVSLRGLYIYHAEVAGLLL